MKLDLLLLRHAKSDWESGEGPDHERPLAPRGVAAAKRTGEWLAAAVPELDLAIASTAVRAAETARLVLRAARLDVPLRLERSFYEAKVEDILAVVRQLDGDRCCVLLVGHEPTWSATASCLIGGGTLRMPTAALAGVRFEVPGWREAGPGAGELRFLVTPKVLEE